MNDHVYVRELSSIRAVYACLSHCWGPQGPKIKLTHATAKQLGRGILVSALPKTFRDAVNVCQQLGIFYIWIDALCKSKSVLN